MRQEDEQEGAQEEATRLLKARMQRSRGEDGSLAGAKRRAKE